MANPTDISIIVTTDAVPEPMKSQALFLARLLDDGHYDILAPSTFAHACKSTLLDWLDRKLITLAEENVKKPVALTAVECNNLRLILASYRNWTYRVIAPEAIDGLAAKFKD